LTAIEAKGRWNSKENGREKSESAGRPGDKHQKGKKVLELVASV